MFKAMFKMLRGPNEATPKRTKNNEKTNVSLI